MVEKRLDSKVARKLLASFLLFAACNTVPLTAVLAQGEPASLQSESASTPRPPLQAGLKHDETLPALPEQFQVGKELNDAQLQSMVPDNLWFPIPDWMAGSWHSEKKTINFVQDCATGRSMSPHVVVTESQDIVHGHQRDKTGRVWEYIEIPRVRKVGLDTGSAYLRALKEDVLVADQNGVTLKYLTNQVSVGGKNKEIVSSKQVQQFITFVPLEDGLVKASASLKDFDETGTPNQLQRAESVLTRTKTYENMDTLNGRDLKKLFADYLQKTGHPELIPNKT